MTVKSKSNGCVSVIMGILMILFGIGAGLYSLYSGYNSANLFLNGSQVNAVVTDMVLGKSENNHTPSSPVFEYIINGKTYKYESGYETYPPRYKIGDHATLIYDPQNPQKAKENIFLELWLLPMIMCPASIVSIFAAIMIMVLGRRTQ